MFLRNPGKEYFYRDNNLASHNSDTLDCELVQHVLVMELFILKYASPWKRLAAFGTNTLLNFFLFYPFFFKKYQKTDPDFELTAFRLNLVWILPLMALVIFILCRTTAPGKFLFKIKIVDSKTGLKPALGQKISRMVGYNFSLFIFGLGFFWIFIDPKRESWHDKIAETVVIEENLF